jgi:hypothetical protein
LPAVEEVWPDHRKSNHPTTFDEARELLLTLIPARRDLLVAPEYSNDLMTICQRCVPSLHFRLAEPQMLFSLLGYC